MQVAVAAGLILIRAAQAVLVAAVMERIAETVTMALQILAAEQEQLALEPEAQAVQA